MKRNKN